jgi:CMP/dCMP kinase
VKGGLSAILRGPMEGLLIAIDGPAGSGKSSVARTVAGRLGFVNLNTGAAYRAVALLALRESVELEDGEALAALSRRVGLDAQGARIDGVPVLESDLRAPEVSAAASTVSAKPEVRAVLLGVQRKAARRARLEGGAVVEGRDIGTVVLPDANLKIYLSAEPEERARRRAHQTGREEELDRIREAMKKRDRQDSQRETSPLKPAPDAVILDTTSLDLEGVVARVLELARGLREKGA